jgi:hypothetical protein
MNEVIEYRCPKCGGFLASSGRYECIDCGCWYDSLEDTITPDVYQDWYEDFAGWFRTPPDEDDAVYYFLKGCSPDEAYQQVVEDMAYEYEEPL